MLIAFLAGAHADAQATVVKASQKISNLSGNLGAVIDPGDVFGNSYFVGDIDGDGLREIAIGVGGSDDGVSGAGGIWLLGLNSDGTVANADKISLLSGGFGGVLDDGDAFGSSVASIGDLDGDGVEDIAVGARGDTDGAPPVTWRGALWILRMNADRTVKAWSKINETNGGFTGVFQDFEYFGSGLASLGDLNGDGVCDLAVGARGDSPGQAGDGGGGSVWILFLDSLGNVISHTEIATGKSGLKGVLDSGDQFGNAVSNIGDFDGDGVVDIAVGVKRDDDGGTSTSADYGAVYILFLNTDGTVKAEQKISLTQGGFTGSLSVGAFFGTTVTSVGDLDGDGVTDLAVGAKGDDDGFDKAGSAFILFMNADATVRVHVKISSTKGGLMEEIEAGDFFGSGLTCIGDLDLDGVQDLLIGARTDDDGGMDTGAAYVVFLNEAAWASPVADFVASSAVGLVPLTTTFADLSTGGRINSWFWDFGDGLTSTLASPQNTYLSEGVYTVSLTVSGPFGADAKVVDDLVFASNDTASSVLRNGAGTNPLIFDSNSSPLLGQDWLSCVDVSSFPAANLVALVGFESPLGGLLLNQGELLIDPFSSSYLSILAVPSGGLSSFSVAIPLDLGLSGLPAYNQCVVFGGSTTLTNAVDLVLGL